MLIMVNTQQDGPIIGYMRISNAPLVRRHGGNLDPIWLPPPPPLLLPPKYQKNHRILQEFCDFSGTWDLRYLIFLMMQFLQKFWFLVIFLVSQQ